MQYLTLSSDYDDPCLVNALGEAISFEKLGIKPDLRAELFYWGRKYRFIIPLELEQRKRYSELIDKLDAWGIALARRLAVELDGRVKIKYYSEGRLKVLVEVCSQ